MYVYIYVYIYIYVCVCIYIYKYTYILCIFHNTLRIFSRSTIATMCLHAYMINIFIYINCEFVRVSSASFPDVRLQRNIAMEYALRERSLHTNEPRMRCTHQRVRQHVCHATTLGIFRCVTNERCVAQTSPKWNGMCVMTLKFFSNA